MSLLPVLIKITDAVLAVLRAFNGMPPLLQNIVLGVVALGIAIGVLAPIIASLIQIGTALAGLKIGATIAAWAAGIGPAIAGIKVALSGFLAFMSSGFIPALIAFFSGPAGWTVLAVAAVIALVVVFREQIGGFLSWLFNTWKSTTMAIWSVVETLFVKPWQERYKLLALTVKATVDGIIALWRAFAGFIYSSVIQPIGAAWNALGNTIRSAFQGVVGYVRGLWDGVVNTITGGVRVVASAIRAVLNPVIGMVNRVIRGFNTVSAKVGGPQLGQIPAFAEGGIVRRPTLAMVGEGGEPEYIIPASKMPAASARFMAGQRGDAVLSGGGTGGGAPQINITTGPVLQQDGQRYVTIDDLERAMRVTAEGLMGRLRTPSARIALGLR